MGEPRRSELLYEGPIEVAGTVIEAELRSNGRVWAVMSGGQVLAHFKDAVTTFANGFMSVTGHPPNEVEGVTATWRVPKPEVFDFRLQDMTVRAADRPDLKHATISRSQYRVQIEGPNGVDLSLPGARMEILQGKRAIIDADGIVYMLEEKDCGCGTKK